MVRIFQMWPIIDDICAGEPVPISMWRARADQLHMTIAFTLEQPLVATIYAIIFYYFLVVYDYKQTYFMSCFEF